MLKSITIRGAREQAARRLQINPIPRPLHGRNLRHALGRYGWNKLRGSLLADNSRTCEFCGSATSQSRDLHLHEGWSYEITSTPPVAKLERLSLVCPVCHGCEHFPRTLQWSDQPKQFVEHYCQVNGVTHRDFDHDLKVALERWATQSEIVSWQFNFGAYTNLVNAHQARAERPRTKVKLNPATDSEPARPSVGPRRGRPPLFGRAMTSAESTARSRALKKQAKIEAAEIAEMRAVPVIVLTDRRSGEDRE